MAVGGTGYGRLDIRMDKVTGKLYMLEVNAQCGLSEDEDHTSIGAILRYAGKSFSGLVRNIINDAFARRNLTL
jgi:D-alanine-D-alanine ligase